VSDATDPDQVVATTERIYLRLQHSKYTSAQLSGWIHAVEQFDLKRGLVFFAPEGANADPAIAQQFLRLAQKPVPKRASAATSYPGKRDQEGAR
jgi:hypothetical protein